ncbi:MAG TPA: HAMP domain-containing protein, partial [Thermoanaerobaculia bacterium]|nr:HAMP domain-containing protein [Thermoanaerobaculia bacterium]
RDAEALPTSGPAAPVPADRGVAGGARASEPLRQLREALALLLWDRRQFEELMVIDPQGRVVVSTHEEHEGHNAEALAYFRSGLARTFVQPVFLSPITQRLTMVVATPLRDPERGVQGVLAARLNVGNLFRVVNEIAGLGESGETVAARREGQRLVLVAPTRHDPEAALQRSLLLGDRRGRPLQEAALGRSGAGRGLDYRGVDVLAAWEHVPALDWGVVVKVDRAEALRPAVDAGLRAIALTIPLILGVLLVSLLASRALVQPLADLRAAADRISRGDFDVQVDVHSRDEVGELADSFDRMVAAIKFFREHSRREEEEALDEELVE